MKNALMSVLLALFALTFSACGSSGGGSTTSTEALAGLATCTAQTGASVICGTAYSADGTTPVANVTVSKVVSTDEAAPIKGTASATECKTDAAGAFACVDTTCSGNTTFQISGGIFSTPLQFTATCTPGATTTVAASATTATSGSSAGIKWLVVPGTYDGIQLLLAQMKGCTLTGDTATPEDLTSSAECVTAGLTVLDGAEVETFLKTETLSTYQAIFVNCGASDFSSDAAVVTALQGYVTAGGNMYFSDLSDSMLTVIFPSLITFAGNSTSSGTLVGTTIVDTGLQTFLGATTMDIEFNFDVWTAIGSVTSGWSTYVQGDISPLAPALTGTRPITVGGPKDSGCIFYTSYHVEGGGTGTAQEKALKFLVLNKVGNCQ